MKLHRNCPRSIRALSLLPPLWLRPLQVMALTLPLLLGLTFGVSAAPGTPAPHAGAHVYLLRGLLNIFSLGMDEIAAKLNQQGIETTVRNHLLWPALAEEAAAEYKSGRVRTIILVGHSAGAGAAASMAERLGQLGIPVKLVISLDPITHHTASRNVAHYVNYYVGDGAGEPVAKGPHFAGMLQNVDVEKMPDVGHFTIDKNQAMQQRVIREIRAAL